MTDIVDAATRSRMMSGIRGKNTKPEMIVRQRLHAMGFRFRLHDKALVGKPDIVLRRWQACVFVQGCFWHRHDQCRFATTPATRPDFWARKFTQNVERDRRTVTALREAGWRIATMWECSLKRDDAAAIDLLAAWLRSEDALIEIE